MLPGLRGCLRKRFPEPPWLLLLPREGSDGAGKGGEEGELSVGTEGSRGNIQAVNSPRVKKWSKRCLITPSCRSHQSPKGHQVTRALWGERKRGRIGSVALHPSSQPKSYRNKTTKHKPRQFALPS